MFLFRFMGIALYNESIRRAPGGLLQLYGTERAGTEKSSVNENHALYRLFTALRYYILNRPYGRN